MVVLKEMVGRKVINGFKGVIDFYYCRGVPCARTWPRKPSGKRSPAVMQGVELFKLASQLAPQITPQVRQAYLEMAVGTNLTWRDIFFRGYISGTLRYFYAVDEYEEPP